MKLVLEWTHWGQRLSCRDGIAVGELDEERSRPRIHNAKLEADEGERYIGSQYYLARTNES